MASKKLVEQIVRNYYGMSQTLESYGKHNSMTLREYLEGIMLTEPNVYDKSDIEYGMQYGEKLKSR